MIRLSVLSLCLLLATSAAPTYAQSQSDSVATLQRLVAAVNRGDIPGQLAVFTGDAVVIGGPCGGPPANGECVGQTQIRAALEQGGTGVSVALSNIQVLGDGNTVTFRTTEAFPLPPEVTAAGIHRQVELGTAVITNGKIDRLALVLDVTDSQSVALQRLFAQMGPGPNGPTPTIASDGQSLATQSAATQAQFLAAYGDHAAEQWAAQHQSTLNH
jgi:hypothetical protein